MLAAYQTRVISIHTQGGTHKGNVNTRVCIHLSNINWHMLHARPGPQSADKHKSFPFLSPKEVDVGVCGGGNYLGQYLLSSPFPLQVLRNTKIMTHRTLSARIHADKRNPCKISARVRGRKEGPALYSIQVNDLLTITSMFLTYQQEDIC